MRGCLHDFPSSPNPIPRLDLSDGASLQFGKSELQQLHDAIDAIVQRHHSRLQECVKTWAARQSAVEPETLPEQPSAANREISLLRRAAATPTQAERPRTREAWQTGPATPALTHRHPPVQQSTREDDDDVGRVLEEAIIKPFNSTDTSDLEDGGGSFLSRRIARAADKGGDSLASTRRLLHLTLEELDDTTSPTQPSRDLPRDKFTDTVGSDWFSTTLSELNTNNFRLPMNTPTGVRRFQTGGTATALSPAAATWGGDRPPSGPPPTVALQQEGTAWSTTMPLTLAEEEPQPPPGLGRRQQRSSSSGWREMVASHELFSPMRGSYHRRRTRAERFLNDNMHANDYLTQRARKEAKRVETALERFTTSKFFEWASMCLILSNTVFIGVHTAYMTQYDGQSVRRSLVPPADDGALVLFVIQIMFCIWFCVEFALRWSTDGLVLFFRTKEKGWNIFDTIIVIITVLELVLEFIDGAWLMSDNVMVLRVLRVLRVVRVIRIIRVVRFFRDLRIMVHTLITSVISLIWVVCVLVGLLYIFGISLTWGTYEYLITDAHWQDPSSAELRESFGTLQNSVLSLYMAVIGGRDWSDYWDMLKPLPMVYQMQFLFYITFTIFAVMNVVTGVFVDSAFEFRKADRDLIIQEAMYAKQNFRQNLKELFMEIDIDDSGSIALEEFEEIINDPRAVAFFTALDLDFHEATTLFHLLDVDRSGRVDTDEFLNGCQKLKGGAKTVDLAVVQREVQWLLELFMSFADFVEDKLENMPKNEPDEDAENYSQVCEV